MYFLRPQLLHLKDQNRTKCEGYGLGLLSTSWSSFHHVQKEPTLCVCVCCVNRCDRWSLLLSSGWRRCRTNKQQWPLTVFHGNKKIKKHHWRCCILSRHDVWPCVLISTMIPSLYRVYKDRVPQQGGFGTPRRDPNELGTSGIRPGHLRVDGFHAVWNSWD